MGVRLIHLVTSNRMEVLRQTLVELLREPVGGPLDEELVIVPNRGLGRWLAMGLAEDQGICAQTRMDFPRRLITKILDSALGPETAQEAYQPEAMRWALYQLIPQWLEQEEEDHLAVFWRANPSPASRFALCGELARIYDLAIIYRPDEVLRWRQRPHAWFERLFAELSQTLVPDAHLAARIDRYLAGDYRAQLPERISFFGVGCLPPAFMELIHEAARRENCFIYQFQLSPSPGLFEDATTARQQHRMMERGGLLEEEAHLATIHPLLASWGAVARTQQVQNMAAPIDIERPLFLRQEGEGTLHRLQRDLCDLKDRLEAPRKAAPPADDRSLRIHHCHGTLREVEVLKDQILDLLERQPDLQPQDIAVLSTDPATYGPLIQAVFAPELFVATPDLSQVDGADLAQAVCRSLEIAQGDLAFDTVMELLSLDVLQRQWQMPARAVDDLAQLLQQAGIEGARDGEHRAEINQAGGDERTWKQGLERIALGLMLPSGADRIVEGRLPVDPSDPEALMVITGVLDALFSLQRTLQEEAPVVSGVAAVEAALVALLGPRVTRELGSVFDGISRQARWRDDDGLVPVNLLAQVLQTELEQVSDEGQFLSGGVTIGGLQPLRAIPFQAIYVLGLGASAQAFPRPSSAGDLQQQILGTPRQGDRDPRQEDLDLFLQLLLSARRELGLFVSSVSADDGAEVPISVVVDQLLDLVMTDSGSSDHDMPEDRELLRRRWVVQHPLHPFDARSFDRAETGGSFAADYHQAARPEVFGWSGGLPPDAVAIDRLDSWYRDSLAEGLRLDLGLRLRARIRRSQTSAQQSLPSWLRFELATALLKDPDKDKDWLEASGRLTPGRSGGLQAQQVLDTVEACPIVPFVPVRPVPVDLMIAGRRVHGQLPGEATIIESRGKGPSLRAWMDHVIRQVVVGPGPTRVLCRGAKSTEWLDLAYEPMSTAVAGAQLETLVQLYVEGITDGWIFLGSVLSTFAQERAKSAHPGDRQAWRKARSVWWEQREQEHLRRCLGPEAPLPGENEEWFRRLVEHVFLPAHEGGRSS